MIETKKYCYCDILSEHAGKKVDGASSYKDVVVMKIGEDNETAFPVKMSLDMCPECYNKYHSNLYINYDLRGRTSYSFSPDEASEEDTPSQPG